MLLLFFVSTFFVLSSTLDPKSVNINFETALVFEPQDIQKHYKLLIGAEKILNSLKTMLIPRSFEPKFRETSKLTLRKDRILTDYIHNLNNILNDLKDEDLKTVIKVLNEKLKKHSKDNPIFNQLIYEKNLKLFLHKTLENLVQNEPYLLRRLMKDYTRTRRYEAIKTILGALDRFYNTKDQKKLEKNLRDLSKIDRNIDSAVENALNDVIFDKYDSLTYESKEKIADLVTALGEFVSKGQVYKFNDESEHKSDEKDVFKPAKTPTVLVLNKNIELNLKSPQKGGNLDISFKNKKKVEDKHSGVQSDLSVY